MSQFLAELMEQPDVLRATLDRCLASGAHCLFQVKRTMQEKKLARLVFSGMGSSYFAPLVVASYLNEHKIPTHVIEAAELAYYGTDVITPDTLLVAVSRSGETIEVRKMLERTRGWATILGLSLIHI